MAETHYAVANIMKSSATVWYAPVGESEPDETSVAVGGDWGGNWEKIGYTDSDVQFIVEMATIDLTVDQLFGTSRRNYESVDARFEFTIAEPTARNAALAAGLDPDDAVTDTSAGASQKAFAEFDMVVPTCGKLSEWMVGLEGAWCDDDGNNHPLRIFIQRANIMQNGSLTFTSRGDTKVGIPMQVKSLVDTATTNRFYTYQRVYEPTS